MHAASVFRGWADVTTLLRVIRERRHGRSIGGGFRIREAASGDRLEQGPPRDVW
jgi:hypothetical protein